MATAVAVLGCAAVAIARRSITVGALGAAALAGVVLARPPIPPASGCFLPDTGVAEKVWLEATVVGAPARVPDGWKMEARAVRAGRGEEVCGVVLLTIADPTLELRIGDTLRLHAHLRRPRNFGNPGAWDQAGALARRGVFVTAWCGGASPIEQGGASWAATIAAQRSRIATLVDRSLAAPDAALLRALVIGDTSAVSEEDWRVLSDSGIVHLLSVSGLHIAIVWGLVFAAVRWLLARSERLLLSCDVRLVAALVAAGPAIFYAGLAGGSLPTERSLLMVVLLTVALGFGRDVRPSRLLLLAAVVLGVAHPGAPLELSFQLSFVSVFSLVAGADLLRRRPAGTVAEPSATFVRRAGDRLAAAFALSAAAVLGTAPLVAAAFNRVTPIGILTNPLLVPLLGTPATVLGLAGAAISFASDDAAIALFRAAGWALATLRSAASAVLAVPFASFRVPTPTGLEVCLAYAALALPWSGRRGRALAAAIVAVALADVSFWMHERFLHRDLRVRFLDVGQGDAAVIELPGGRVVVVDGGGFARSRFDVGERVVARYLRTRKILRVDALAVTHGDWDHQGGLHALARELGPRELWRGRDDPRLAALETVVQAQGGRIRTLAAGDRPLESAGVVIRCLHPPRAATAFSPNDASLVLSVSFGGVTILLTGDVEAAGESALLGRSEIANVTILKVPHHGSSTSSTARFVDRLRPSVTVFSLGAGNRFGFPHRAVVDRYVRHGARVLRTDEDGSIGVRTDGRLLSVRPYSRASPVFCSALGMLC